MALHLWNGSFAAAGSSPVRAVFVELGTNDIGNIGVKPAVDGWIPAQVEQEWANIYTYLVNAVAAMPNKCIVWLGQNEHWNTYVKDPYGNNVPFTTIAAAHRYNQWLQDIAGSNPHFHYADYNSYVAGNAALHASLASDGIHPSTADGQAALANMEVWMVRASCGF